MSNPYAPPKGPVERPVAAVRIVDRLEDAGRDGVVVVDGKGRVRTRAYRRNILILLWISVVALCAVLGSVLVRVGLGVGSEIGLPLFVAGVVGMVVAFARMRNGRRLTALILADRLDEAEELARGTLRNPLVRGPGRALARLNLAAILHRRGEHAPSLDEIRAARRGFGFLMRRSLQARMAIGLEAEILLALGRVDEAAALLEAVKSFPPGEYFTILRDNLALLVDFHRGTPTVSADDARLIAARSLKMPNRGLPLVLSAWALEKHGFADEAASLLAEARKAPLDRLARVTPQVHAWLVASSNSPVISRTS